MNDKPMAAKSIGEGPSWDREKGELRILGHRNAAVDARALCEYLDSLVGAQVGEVIMKNLETRLGKEDGSWLQKENPQLRPNQLIHIVTEWDRTAGIGATQATLVENGPTSILLEVANPIMKVSQGAARAFLFGWWAGVLTSILGKDFDYTNVAYDPAKDIMKCELVPRSTD
jgi:hypothetical protein